MIVKVEISFPPQLEFKLYHVSRTEEGEEEGGKESGEREEKERASEQSKEQAFRHPVQKPCTAWPLTGLSWMSGFHCCSLS